MSWKKSSWASPSRPTRESLQRPAVDGGEPETDEGHARELPGLQDLAEHQHAEQPRAHRYQERHQQQVGRTGAGEDAEVDDVGDRRAEQGESQDGAPACRARRR